MNNRISAHRAISLLLALAVLAILTGSSRVDSLFAGPQHDPLGVAQQCPADCQTTSNNVNAACLAAGGSVADCLAEANAVLLVCLQFRCGQGPAPGPVTLPCEGQCSDAGSNLYKNCINVEQQPAEVCQARLDAFLAACLSSVCNHVTPTPTATLTCSQRCNDLGATQNEICLANGGLPADCAAQAAAAVALCMASSCQRASATPTLTITVVATEPSGVATDPVTPTNTITPTKTNAPLATATPTFTPTVTATKGPSPTPNPTLLACAESCTARAQQEFDNCKASGGDDAVCEIKRQAALNNCLAKCGAGTPTVVVSRTPTKTPVPLTDCRQACVDQANRYYLQCLHQGRNQDVCQAEAQVLAEQCSFNCNQGTAPPPNLPTPSATPTFSTIKGCEAECDAAARALYERCKAIGGSEATCIKEASIIQADCVNTRCNVPPNPTCLRNCQVSSNNLYITCMRERADKGGGSIPVCSAKAREFLRRCQGTCNGTVFPTPSATPKATRQP